MKNKFFIVGSPRSGTTLLQSMISSDDSVFTLRETHFMGKLRRPTILRLLDNLFVSSRRLTAAHSFIEENNKLLGRYEIKGFFSRKRAVEFLDHVLTNEAVLNGKTSWLEKTPDHLNNVGEFIRYIPGAKIIHSMRDGRDVVASLYDANRKFPGQWKAFATPDSAMFAFNRYVIKSLRFAGADNNYFVSYDALTDNPTKAVSDLNRLLEINMNPDAHAVNSSDTQFVRPNEGWKKEHKGPGVVDTKLKKFRQIFTEEQQDYITSNIISMEEIKNILYDRKAKMVF